MSSYPVTKHLDVLIQLIPELPREPITRFLKSIAEMTDGYMIQYSFIEALCEQRPELSREVVGWDTVVFKLREGQLSFYGKALSLISHVVGKVTPPEREALEICAALSNCVLRALPGMHILPSFLGL